ncbi:hypothetical protein niasHT_029827 [Heterodera trifolii]|uniref:Cytochrome c oxidase subunit Vb n=1 Tax=Heterodera trifolii TaxID=157864 RepID=A0ABD2K0U7_9BILA
MNRLLSGRSLLPKIMRNFSHSKRLAASEADPEHHGYFPDPTEQTWGLEREMLASRLKGEDRYSPKIYYRAEHSTKEVPNVVHVYLEDKVVGCLCEHDGDHVNYWHIRKGDTKRCECGHWFKGVQADTDSFD